MLKKIIFASYLNISLLKKTLFEKHLFKHKP